MILIYMHVFFFLVVGYRSSTAYGYDASSVVKGVKVFYHINSDITIDGTLRSAVLE